MKITGVKQALSLGSTRLLALTQLPFDPCALAPQALRSMIVACSERFAWG